MSDEQRRELYAYPGEGDSPAGAKEGGRDQADIARLLRALNDDLRDDEPAQARSGPRAEPSASAAPPRYQNTGRMISGKPSTIAVGVAIVAAAAIGLGSIMFSGASAPTGSAEPPNLIVPSGGGASTSAAAPGAPAARGGGTSPFASPASPPSAASPPVISPPVISPSASPAPAGMLTPGQTATIVRPPPDSSVSESATVVVQPLSPDAAGSSSPPPPSSLPSSPPSSQTTPKPSSPRPAAAAPASPKPAPASPTPAAKTAAPVGGAGNWAVQVGTFSVSANADQLARRLSQNGRQAYVVDWQDRQGRTWKAVRVGNFGNEAAARAAAAQLKSEMSLSGQVIDLR